MNDDIDNVVDLSSAFLGNRESFKLLCVEYMPLLRSTAQRWCSGTGVSPDDCVQQMLLQVWKWLQSQGKAKEVQPSYLFRALRNTTLNLIRQKQHELAAGELAETMDDDEDRLNELVELPELFGILSPRCQEVVTCIYLDRLSVSETAEKLKISPAAVRQAHHRALAELREILDDNEN